MYLFRRLGDDLTQCEQSLLELEKVLLRLTRQVGQLDVESDSFELDLAKLQLAFGCEVSCFRQRLPVYAHRSKIVESVRGNHVTVLVAETGSGKSSQVPKYLHLDKEEVWGSVINLIWGFKK